MGKRKQPQPVEHVSDDDDEEISEDEAFNSDDERKYGGFFAKQDSGSEEDSDDDGDSGSDEEDSADGDGGQYMLDLLDKLDDNPPKNDPSENSSNNNTMAHHVTESQFSSSVIPQTHLTLDTLMEGLKDTAGFGNVQKTMKGVAAGHTTAAPTARVVSDRAQRQIHYQQQSQQVSEWLHTVQQNRQAETLDFRPTQQQQSSTRDVLVGSFVPTTDFEKQLHAALQQAGQEDEQALLKAEEDALNDDLGAHSQLTLEEYQQRRGQLAKMRALLFYQEQKRHHINKIKSKKYRRIRKKQRLRQKEAELDDNPELLQQQQQEAEELQRIKERMTLAHKNTSKWAKRILKRGKNVDVDTRKALSAQLKRGDDLLKRMNATGKNDDDDNSDEDLVETAKKVLAETENDNDNAVQGKGLFKLSFMQRGIQRQREQAKQEARQLLQELEDEERPSDDDDESADEKQEKKKRPKSGKSASKEEMEHVLKEGEMVASSLKFGNSDTTQVTGGITIDVATTSQHSSTLEASALASSDKLPVAQARDGASKTAHKTSETKNKKVQVHTERSSIQEESNPWLVNDNDKTTTPASTSNKGIYSKKKTKKGMVDIDRAIDLLSPSAEDPNANRKNVKSTNTPDENPKRITALTQEELVARAFAGPTPEEAQEEFDREKEHVTEQEDAGRKKRRDDASKTATSSAGWGSWAGEGAPPPKPPRQLPKKLQPPVLKKKRKRQDQVKPGVIIRERRIKRTADAFMLAQIPHPYTSREEYERAMSGGMGREWNVTSGFQAMTRPEVVTRTGKIIQPLSKKVKRQRPAAKF